MAMQQRLIDDAQAKQFYSHYDTDPTLTKEVTPCSYLQLLHFADNYDKALMVVGSLFALGSGVSLVFYANPLGEMIQAFAPNKDPNQVVESALNAMVSFAINSCFVFFNCWLMFAAWTISAERQSNRARRQYFQSLLRQQVTWHDRNKPQEVSLHMYTQLMQLQSSLVTNFTGLLTQLSIGVSGIVISFTKGWQMALVMMIFLPIMVTNGYFIDRAAKLLNAFTTKRIPQVEGNVLETFENVKTVKYLSGEHHEYKLFERDSNNMVREYLQHKRIPAICSGVFMLCVFLNYSVGFWYGSLKVFQTTYSVGNVVIIFSTLYLGNLNLINIPNSISNFLTSRVAMKHIMNMVQRQPKIELGNNLSIRDITSIQFSNVMFCFYKPLFRNLSMVIPRGITAFIGPSGSGKTTIVNLICKFYSPFRGSITLSNEQSVQDLKDIKQASLLSTIGYVGQEPTLIGNTLRQVLNAEGMSDGEIYSILKMCMADEFVKEIGMDAEYGALSGGQKQRIAIARALCKRPQVLILDEGTSALDRVNEQMILNNLKKEVKFILMVGHRVETIRQASHIVAIDHGSVVGVGTYQEIVEMGLITDVKENKSNQEGKQQIGSKVIEENKEQQMKQQVVKEVQFSFSFICTLLKVNSKYSSLYVIGLILSFVNGTVFPLFSYLISNLISLLASFKYANPQQIPHIKQQSQFYTTLLFILSGVMCVVGVIRTLSMDIVTEMLGCTLQQRLYRKCIEKQQEEIERYGQSEYAMLITKSVGQLKNLGGLHLGSLFQTISTTVCGLLIAFLFSWQVALVSLVMFPLILLAGKAQFDLRYGLANKTESYHKSIQKLVIEAVMNVRTVKSLSLEGQFFSKYDGYLEESEQLACKYAHLSGIALGVGQALTSILFSVIFFIGALFVRSGSITVQQLYTSVLAIMFSGIQAGIGVGFVSGLATAAVHAKKYFAVINEEQLLLQQQNNEDEDDVIEVKNSICFKDVCFRYYNKRRNILDGFNLYIHEGQTVAFVGESGSGKSTLANLLLKVYEQSAGTIEVGGCANLSKRQLSSLISIVSQEPVLFNRSVLENIRYNTAATMGEVIEAARQANCYQFVMEGKFGMQQQGRKECATYDELDEDSDDVDKCFAKGVGPKGSYLSGGQKQRVAIARALVRRPRIMIFDEATSALDTVNEEFIKETMAQIKGVTQIIIAHRLSTIRDCDRIVMLKKGEIIQMGKYEELVQKKGYFYKLVNAIRN